MTEAASSTKMPPMMSRSISCRMTMAMNARSPPRVRDPVSPIKILAGLQLNHRNPRHAPTMAPATMASSEA